MPPHDSRLRKYGLVAPFWLTWGPAAMCYRVNSPFEGSYGMSSGDSDQTLNYLFQAVDTALNASLT